ncbi:MAG TPA: tripartite tricarboxylate transporter substrate binding protein [Thermomicrobiales bacterium]|nr:tripartite tricarboxylate transporter substrate binding protein [Thermomicrobiales bacterium]
MKSSLTLSMASSVGLLLIVGIALAQEYPARTVRMVVPLSPGGGTDIAARVTAQKLTQCWGQQFIVENRPGAGGSIGAELVARAAPDGYTLLVSSPSAIVVNPFLFAKLPYAPKDFVPVVMLAPTYYVLIAHPSVPANSLQELIGVARKQPGKLVLASGGLGAPSDLMGEMFKNLAKIDAVTVQYKGGGQAIADVVGGQADMMFADMIAATSYIDAGRVTLLAVATVERLPQLPNVPTLVESGVPYDAIGWSGVFAPARTPTGIVTKLNNELRTILMLPDVQSKLASDGSAFGSNTPESLAKFIKSELVKYETAVKVSGRRLN